MDAKMRTSTPPLRSKESNEKTDNEIVKHEKGEQGFNEQAGGVDPNVKDMNAKLENPLYGIPHERLQEMGRAFARDKGLGEYESEFAKGAMIAQDPLLFESIEILDEDDKNRLRREVSHKWDQPWRLYFLVVCCSVAAAVQGMDESVTNGANLFWPTTFGVPTTGPNSDRNEWFVGITNSAPYFACAFIGCWLTAPLNYYFGRRGTIFITATASALGCIWSGLTDHWWHLLIARAFLGGAGIGPKSATVPVYSAETAPPLIRGALVCQWQVWTAFGIMLGTVSSLVFFKVPDPSNIRGLNWRLMLGSAALPAFFVMTSIFFCPESPRWLISKGRYPEAFKSLCVLRHTKLQAARDLFFIDALLQEEAKIHTSRPAIIEMFAVPRNRRAAVASGIVMFMQQFCGINVIAYYSSTVFVQAGFGEVNALGATLGFGVLNWVMSVPGVLTIDTFGRRNLLLTTFPLMAIFLLMTGFAFFIPETSKARIAVVALGIYLHCIAYSPGEGPVPFTYSAEAFPLYIRDVGMSYATAITWFFNGILALTFPRLLTAFKPQGAFGFYAAWNIVAFFLVLWFVPETKSLTLEELDQVFSVPTGKHAAYQTRNLGYNFRKYFLRQKVGPREELYPWEREQNEKRVSNDTLVSERDV